ncbi:MAG: GNAT family N-acetyltransferase [Eubacteriales bacterium]|nr:GNAT family N-acetyltransferase [Eubacteriales bacterium]
MNYSKTQTEKSLKNSLHTVAAEKNNQVVGMKRLIDDGMYYIIVDIVVQPDYQQMGIGSKIFDRIVEYVDKETPVRGRSSIQLIAEKGKETFYETKGVKKKQFIIQGEKIWDVF